MVAAVLVVASWVVFRWISAGGGDQRPSVTESSASSTSSSSGVGTTPGGTGKDGAGGGGSHPASTPDLRDEALGIGLIQREYLVLKPSWATSTSNLPLVVVLHGLLVDRFAMLDAADWRGEVEKRGFVAVFPQGFGNSWNVGPCCPPASILQLDDIGFIDSVIDVVEDSGVTDRERVFVTGFSGGGLMTYRYGCERSERLRAIGPVAGVNLTGCRPGRPLALIHQHSDPDPVVPFDGSPGIGQIVSAELLPAVVQSVRDWSRALGCPAGSPWSTVAPKVEALEWDGCRDATRVRLVRLEGVGHEWPRTDDYDGLGAMLDFFGIS